MIQQSKIFKEKQRSHSSYDQKKLINQYTNLSNTSSQNKNDQFKLQLSKLSMQNRYNQGKQLQLENNMQLSQLSQKEMKSSLKFQNNTKNFQKQNFKFQNQSSIKSFLFKNQNDYTKQNFNHYCHVCCQTLSEYDVLNHIQVINYIQQHQKIDPYFDIKQVDHIQNIRQQHLEKIDTCDQYIDNLLDEHGYESNFDNEKLTEQYLQIIQQRKDQLYEVIEDYFQNFTIQLVQLIQKQGQYDKLENNKKIFQKMILIQDQLRRFKIDIQDQKQFNIESVKQVHKLNQSKLINGLKNELQQNMKQQPELINFTSSIHHSNDVQNFLEQYLSIDILEQNQQRIEEVSQKTQSNSYEQPNYQEDSKNTDNQYFKKQNITEKENINHILINNNEQKINNFSPIQSVKQSEHYSYQQQQDEQNYQDIKLDVIEKKEKSQQISQNNLINDHKISEKNDENFDLPDSLNIDDDKHKPLQIQSQNVKKISQNTQNSAFNQSQEYNDKQNKDKNLFKSFKNVQNQLQHTKEPLKQKSSMQKSSSEYNENIMPMSYLKNQQQEKLNISISKTQNQPQLFFFQQSSKNLYIQDLITFLVNKQTNFKQKKLDIQFEIPAFHRSLCINDEIYLVGGSLKNKERSNLIMKYNAKNYKLDLAAKLRYPRSSHSIVGIDQKIYIIGGFDENNQLMNNCEVFDIQSKKISQIAPINIACTSPAICNFENKYIFKFGGKIMSDSLSQQIEFYDIEKNIWIVIEPQIRFQINQQDFKLLSYSSCTQINQNQIIVFGGYDYKNTNSDQFFVFELDNIKNMYQNDNFIIKDINLYKLPHKEVNFLNKGFWEQQPIIYENKIYAIQNMPGIQDDRVDHTQEDKRQILQFDGEHWQTFKS